MIIKNVINWLLPYYGNIDTLITTIFTVNGILFSVAFSIIIAINLLEIKNIKLYEEFSNILNRKSSSIKRCFVFTAIFVCLSSIIDIWFIKLISLVICLFFLIQLILSFEGIYKFKRDLENQIQKDKRDLEK
jgi:hypothetical protein